MDLRIGVDFFKGFQIRSIVYILQWDLCNVYHVWLDKMLQIESCEPAVLRAHIAELWEKASRSLTAL